MKKKNMGYDNREEYINKTYPELKKKARESYNNILKLKNLNIIEPLEFDSGWLNVIWDNKGDLKFQNSFFYQNKLNIRTKKR